MTRNDNSSYYTGWGGNAVRGSGSVTYDAGATDNLYTGQYGQLASTTGNISGVYDMVGGATEHVSAYNKSYSGANFTNNGSSFASTGGISTKYATAYDNSSSTYTPSSIASFFDNRHVSNIGDAFHEVWRNGRWSWRGDDLYIIYLSGPFAMRGGAISNNSDVFYAYRSGGEANANRTFRVCLTP